MASNDTSFNVRSALTFVDDSEAALARAGEAVARVEREIDHLWRDSMMERPCDVGTAR